MMIAKKIFIKNRFGEKLEALKEYSKGKGPLPAVLMVPGLAMDLHEWAGSFDEVSQKLVNNGFLVLRFSFAGCGKSDGDFKEMTISRQAAQVQDVFSFLQKEPLVDKKRIGILAQSMGGPSVIQAFPLPIKSLLLLSTVFKPAESLQKVLKERNVKIDPKKVTYVPRSDDSLTPLGPQIWDDFKKINLKTKIQKLVTFPTLIIHGELDTYVTTREVRKYFKYFKAKKELAIYPKGDHGFDDISRNLRNEILEKIVSWFTISLTN